MDLALLSSTKDLYLTSTSDLAVVKEIDSIQQHIAQRMRLFLGEWFLDTSRGVPYYQTVFQKNPNLQIMTGIFQQSIIESPGVEELLKFTLDFNNQTRVLSLDFSVRTADGVIQFIETVVT